MPDENFYSLSANTLQALDEARKKLSQMLKRRPHPKRGEETQIHIQQTQVEFNWQKVYHLTRGVAKELFTMTPPSTKNAPRAAPTVVEQVRQAHCPQRRPPASA